MDVDSPPSRTALATARYRAVHQVRDGGRVLHDPLAVQILGEPTDDLQSANVDRRMQLFVCARARYAEEVLAAAVPHGMDQLVVLGAGLDTFAYRNPHPELRVFEVDYPATQAWKRSRLEHGGIAVPGSLTFAPTDFETQSVEEGLRGAGFSTEAPAFFSWLGVTMYLSREAIRSTLRFVAQGTAPGSGIVFDYALAREHLGLVQRFVYDALAARVAAAGEPWISTFDPVALRGELLSLGFSGADDITGDALNARYFEGRKDGLRVGGLVRLMRAAV